MKFTPRIKDYGLSKRSDISIQYGHNEGAVREESL